MQQMTKRWLSLLLAAVLCVTAGGVPALAAELAEENTAAADSRTGGDTGDNDTAADSETPENPSDNGGQPADDDSGKTPDGSFADAGIKPAALALTALPEDFFTSVEFGKGYDEATGALTPFGEGEKISADTPITMEFHYEIPEGASLTKGFTYEFEVDAPLAFKVDFDITGEDGKTVVARGTTSKTGFTLTFLDEDYCQEGSKGYFYVGAAFTLDEASLKAKTTSGENAGTFAYTDGRLTFTTKFDPDNADFLHSPNKNGDTITFCNEAKAKITAPSFKDENGQIVLGESEEGALKTNEGKADASVSITYASLGKSGKLTTGTTVHWFITAKNSLNQKNPRIVDTLPKLMELADGSLKWSDGTALVKGTDYTYDSTTNVLTIFLKKNTTEEQNVEYDTQFRDENTLTAAEKADLAAVRLENRDRADRRQGAA